MFDQDRGRHRPCAVGHDAVTEASRRRSMGPRKLGRVPLSDPCPGLPSVGFGALGNGLGVRVDLLRTRRDAGLLSEC